MGGSGRFVGPVDYLRRTQSFVGRCTIMRARTALRKASSVMCMSDWMMSEYKFLECKLCSAEIEMCSKNHYIS